MTAQDRIQGPCGSRGDMTNNNYEVLREVVRQKNFARAAAHAAGSEALLPEGAINLTGMESYRAF